VSIAGPVLGGSIINPTGEHYRNNQRDQRAEFLDEIQTKVFLLAIHSHLYSFALRFPFSSNSRNLLHFLQFILYSVKEKGGKPARKPYPLP
jgi:hypothetical protein